MFKEVHWCVNHNRQEADIVIYRCQPQQNVPVVIVLLINKYLLSHRCLWIMCAQTCPFHPLAVRARHKSPLQADLKHFLLKDLWKYLLSWVWLWVDSVSPWIQQLCTISHVVIRSCIMLPNLCLCSITCMPTVIRSYASHIMFWNL